MFAYLDYAPIQTTAYGDDLRIGGNEYDEGEKKENPQVICWSHFNIFHHIKSDLLSQWRNSDEGLVDALLSHLRGLEQRLIAQTAQVERKVDDLRARIFGGHNFQKSSEAFPGERSAKEQCCTPSTMLFAHVDGERVPLDREWTAAIQKAAEDPTSQLSRIEKRLGEVADAVGAQSAPTAGASTKEDDCKRLKERLKGALELEHTRQSQLLSDQRRETWMEYFFGICKPDGRLGKNGSRFDKPIT